MRLFLSGRIANIDFIAVTSKVFVLVYSKWGSFRLQPPKTKHQGAVRPLSEFKHDYLPHSYWVKLEACRNELQWEERGTNIGWRRTVSVTEVTLTSTFFFLFNSFRMCDMQGVSG